MPVRRFALAAALALLLAVPAAAAPSAFSVLAARAAADDLIQRSKADGVFENITTTDVPTVRHPGSGLVCSFAPGQSAMLLIYPGLPRGDDVSCGAGFPGGVNTLYATRPRRPISLDQAFARYMGEVARASPGARPYEGQFAGANDPDLPERRTQRFELRVAGKGPERFSRLSVAIVGDWVIEQRLTGPLVQAQGLDSLGEAVMTAALRTLTAQAPPR